MNKKPDPEMIDNENPEWTDEMFEKAVPLSGLPKELQANYAGIVARRKNRSRYRRLSDSMKILLLHSEQPVKAGKHVLTI